MPFDDGFSKPRDARMPTDYVLRIEDSVADALRILGCVKDTAEFRSGFRVTCMEQRERGWTAESLWSAMQAHAAQLGRAAPDKKASARDPRLDFGALAVLCCAQAVGAVRVGDATTAWTYVVDAQWAADALRAMIKDAHLAEIGRRWTARQAAKASHAEDRDAKNTAIAAYRNGDFGSKNEAAQAIAGDLVGYGVKRVRRWLQGVPEPKEK